MPSIAFSIDIDRPVAEVFEFTNDPSKVPLWQPGVVEEVLTPERPVGVGARTRRIATRRGREMVSEGVCMEYVPNERIVWESTSGPVARANVITYEPANDGTRFTFELIPRGWLGVLAWPLRPFLAPALRRVVNEQLTRLKTVMEAETPGTDRGRAGPDNRVGD